ncbi:hypothetical protein MRS44_016409 [Fusarium solani]|uniref:Alkali metal cation/H+ antiporter Nha1 C terminus-domain-containing protein n=1 Tax=Fusarium solani TaxID=169388 RepID=A0A9P9KF30_FUSSL|nr:alkali metal cation/H+ antiporter Nha1 C terminus-domain-containing protein [Fusarium solani]KAH7254936.1 alkali metal cation/H+ antiporter Nha1 C terminus-domain-containing protein [Fusarium solani]KAJ3456386.1 hypothetical protein MRS44_016409 [Fusarium solani]
MEVALTFGSLGDIIAICQVAVQLGRAIGVGSGVVGESAKEYQDFREDLDAFVRILMQVVATYQQHEFSPYLDGLDKAVKSVIDQCGSLIQDTLEHIQPKYHESLRIGGSGKKINDIYRKIEWSMREKDRLRYTREKLQDGVQRLSLLTTLAARKSAGVDNATLCSRIEEIRQLVSDTCQGREEMFELLRVQSRASENQAQKLEDVSQQLVTQEKSSRDILGLAKDTFCGMLEVKALLVQISQTVINLQVMATHSMFLRPLDPTKELPVILEDALGNELPIPAQWLDSLEWEVLYGLLKGHFKGRNGYDMVLNRQYALEESSSGRDLDTNRPLHFCLRRGMKINMSMIFNASTVVTGTCPRCNKVTDVPEDVTVQCTRPDCGMWFRTQRVVIEASETSDPSEGNKPIGQRSTITTSIPVQPADFQRVRLLRQETPKLQNTSPSGEMYNIEMEDRKNERRHQPARAFQIGNKIIIEDEDGEVVKTYELPTSQDHNTDDSKSSAASREEANFGGVFGRAVAGEQAREKSVVAETEAADDKDIRFTTGGVGRRMTKDEFIHEVQKLDSNTKASPGL